MKGKTKISLDNFKQTPRDYQEEAITKALSLGEGERILLSSPTGTGKGTMELALLRKLLLRGDEAIIVTPSLEVLRGYLERCGASSDDLEVSESKLAALGESIRVWTPVRVRNQLKKGCFNKPETIIVDEAHHAVDDTISGGGLRELLPQTRWIGFTATSYRGTPEETKELRKAWGDPFSVLTIRKAVENGSWALPSFRVSPIVDDDKVKIKGGDLDADEISLDTVEELAQMVASLDLLIPTCVTLPSVRAAEALHEEIVTQWDLQGEVVVGKTPAQERAQKYERVKKGGVLLISVKVLGEGVDLPWLRVWVDASPTLSPVAFMQKLGRITRPGQTPPQYIGTNRNLERHGYLLEGLLPREAIREAQEAFGGPSHRGSRAGMIKAVSKIKPTVLPLLDGVKGTMWSFWEPDQQGGAGYERVIILDPTSDRVISARHKKEIEQGKWKEKFAPVEIPDKIEGVSIAKTRGQASEKQTQWWKKSAARFGLDPSVQPSKAQFLALPVFMDLAELGVSLEKESAVVKSPGGGGNLPILQPNLITTGNSPGAPGGFSPLLTPPGPEKPLLSAPKGTPSGILSTPPGPSPILRGYFTVVRESGDRRTYRVSTMPKEAQFAPGKTVVGLLTGPDNTSNYSGIAFADSSGLRVWKRVESHKEEYVEDWKTITGDPTKAGKAYALHSGNCYICGRLLTTPESIERGIGPWCSEKD